MEKRAIVVCPGRGTYNKEELGYLQRFHVDRLPALSFIDDYRRDIGQPTVTELDAKEKFSFKLHTLGEHASPLIYACALADFLAINEEQYNIVACTGNSMGWYIALSVAGALSHHDSIDLINTMGSMMKQGLVGGQIIYPAIDEQWRVIPGKKAALLSCVDSINQDPANALYLSIDLGGYLVLAGNESGLKAFEHSVPQIEERFPMRLYNHGAFHTPLMQEISEKGFQQLHAVQFQAPQIPLVDGRGGIWTSYSTDGEALKQYTLGHQVVEPYDFRQALTVSLKEFAPDVVLVLGPGSTLGSSVAQTMIDIGWQGLDTKEAFVARQKTDPVIISMGMPQQRAMAMI